MPQEKRYLIKTYYIGDNYLGSQRQPDKKTIEGTIIEGLIDKNYIKDERESGFEAASRTDRYVSARGAVFSFISQKKFYPEELNTALPNDIGVWSYTIVPLDYMPRWNAVSRHYKYIIEHPISYLENKMDFDINLVKKGCDIIKGQHDFVNFSKKDKNNDKNTIKDFDIAELSIINDYIIIEFQSKSFLRQQVRRMVKKLIELGSKEINMDDFKSLFDSKSSFSYKPVSPRGLILWDVKYPEERLFNENKKGLDRMTLHFNERFNYFAFRTLFFKIIKEKM